MSILKQMLLAYLNITKVYGGWASYMKQIEKFVFRLPNYRRVICWFQATSTSSFCCCVGGLIPTSNRCSSG